MTVLILADAAEKTLLKPFNEESTSINVHEEQQSNDTTVDEEISFLLTCIIEGSSPKQTPLSAAAVA